MAVEFNIYAGGRRVCSLVPQERLGQRIAEVRNCYPDLHVTVYRIAPLFFAAYLPCTADETCEPDPTPACLPCLEEGV